jgi:hypothetical protein
LRQGLDRLHQGTGFFGGDEAALRATRDDVKARIRNLGLSQHEQFIIDKLHFQVAQVDYHHDGASCDSFIASLLKNPSYSGRLHDAVRPAYSALLREVNAARGKTLDRVTIRLISLRGKNSLTTGIALGAVFPQNGGWVFEIPQPPLPAAWRSDAIPVAAYPLRVEETSGDPSGDSIAYVFNIKGNALRDVRGYIADNSLPIKAVVAVEPAGSSGALSIADDREAVSLALSARDELHKALTRHDVRVTHLFFYGPFALSVFVGQLLSAIGRVQLYEFLDPGYVLTATLRT